MLLEWPTTGQSPVRRERRWAGGGASALAVSVGLAIAIAWPRDWYLGADRGPLERGVANGTVTLAQVNLSLVARAERNWTQNFETMTVLYRLFAVLRAVIGLQVVAWAVAAI